jgi:hypothetical protein
MWSLQHQTMVIQAQELTKYWHWLLVLATLLALLPLEHFIINQHRVIVQETHEFIHLNVNTLVEKWLPCDMLLMQTSL